VRRLLFGTALAVLVAVAGCERPRSRVHGAVKYQDKPLAGAVVTFFGPDNMTYTTDTRADGTYEIAGLPRGPIRVSVQVPPPRPRPRPDPDLRKGGDAFARAQAKADDAKLARPSEPAPGPSRSAGGFPARYGDPNTSGLAFDLKEADQDYSLDLK
jgi:hypothetical protein